MIQNLNTECNRCRTMIDPAKHDRTECNDRMIEGYKHALVGFDARLKRMEKVLVMILKGPDGPDLMGVPKPKLTIVGEDPMNPVPRN